MKVVTRLSIIIVTFNSEKYIENCVDKVLKSEKINHRMEIIIFDNNSSDKTVEILKKIAIKYKNDSIKVIYNTDNIGFSKGVNKAISYKKSDLYLVINPDVLVNKSTLKKVLNCQLKNGAGIVGVKTVDSFGNKNGSYFRTPGIAVGIFDFTNLRKVFGEYWHNYFYYNDLSEDKIVDGYGVDIVTGGFMLISSSVINKIGLFDTRYFMYLEDVDFCNRAKRANFKIVVCDEVVLHISGASSDNSDRVSHLAWQSSRKKYYWKNHNIVSNLIIQPIFYIDDLLINVLRKLKK